MKRKIAILLICALLIFSICACYSTLCANSTEMHDFIAGTAEAIRCP